MADHSGGPWACARCTFLNINPTFLACEVCQRPRGGGEEKPSSSTTATATMGTTTSTKTTTATSATKALEWKRKNSPGGGARNNERHNSGNSEDGGGRAPPPKKPKRYPKLERQQSSVPADMLEREFEVWAKGRGEGSGLKRTLVRDGEIHVAIPTLKGEGWINLEVHAQMGGHLFATNGSSAPDSLEELIREVNGMIVKESKSDLGGVLTRFLSDFEKRRERIETDLHALEAEEWGGDDGPTADDWDDDDDDGAGGGDWKDADDCDPEVRKGLPLEHTLYKRWDAREAELRAADTEKSFVDSKEFKAASGGNTAFTPSAVSLMLKKSLYRLMQSHYNGETEWLDVSAIDDNIFHWRVRFRGFGHSSDLNSDLTMLDSRYEGRDYVEFHVKFDMKLHPFYPPQLVSIFPRLENFFVAAIVCMDELLLEKWKPVTRVDDILKKIHGMLAEHARVDPTLAINNPDNHKLGTSYGKVEQLLCRLSQVTSVPPRTYTSLGLKTLKLDGDQKLKSAKAPTLKKQLSGEAPSGGDMVEYISLLAQRRQKRKDIKAAFSEVVCNLVGTSISPDFTFVVKNSALLSVVEGYLDGTTAAQMNKHSRMYVGVLTVCRVIVNVPALHSLLFVPISEKKKCLHQYLAAVGLRSTKSHVDALITFLSQAAQWRLEFYRAQRQICKLDYAAHTIEGEGKQQRGGKTNKGSSSLEQFICPICDKICADWRQGEKHVDGCIGGILGVIGDVHVADEFDVIAIKEDRSKCAFCKLGKHEKLAGHMKNCWACPMCTRSMDAKELPNHVAKCVRWYSADTEEQANVDKLRQAQADLEPCQVKALDHVKREAKIMSESERRNLETRFEKLGFLRSDLDLVNRYIRNEAPIIIHFDCDKVLQYFVSDTHYRNLFEVGRGGGSTNKTVRAGWERTIFKGAYEGSKPFHRPKYGVLNFSNDPCGVKQCYSYGDSFMLLRNVRLRTTFARKDTSGVGSVKDMATCEYYMHVMSGFSDGELKDALKIASGKPGEYIKESARQVNYREVQIHGEVRLDRDVSCLVINKRHKNKNNITNLLGQFRNKHNVPWVWMDK